MTVMMNSRNKTLAKRQMKAVFDPFIRKADERKQQKMLKKINEKKGAE
jgi:hypothetical protein